MRTKIYDHKGISLINRFAPLKGMLVWVERPAELLSHTTLSEDQACAVERILRRE